MCTVTIQTHICRLVILVKFIDAQHFILFFDLIIRDVGFQRRLIELFPVLLLAFMNAYFLCNDVIMAASLVNMNFPVDKGRAVFYFLRSIVNYLESQCKVICFNIDCMTFLRPCIIDVVDLNGRAYLGYKHDEF